MKKPAALAVALLLVVGCGGREQGGGERTSRSAEAPSGATRGPQAGVSPAGHRDGGDLGAAPEAVPGARLVASGAVQTLAPDPARHRIAQRNAYGSIKAFGEEVEGGEATEITFALVQYLDAKRTGDWGTACDRLHSQLRRGLAQLAGASGESKPESASCPEAFREAMLRVPRPLLKRQAEIDVSSVRRDEGNRAFVIYKTPGTLSADMPMFLEDDVWRVGAIEAYALRRVP